MTSSSVRLVGWPREAHRRAVLHHVSLRRDCTAAGGMTDDDRSTADTYAAVLDSVDGLGQVVIVDPELAAVAAVLAEAVDELEQRCRAQGVVGAVATPEVQAYRRWLLGEIAAQTAGAPSPQPYSGPSVDGDDDAPLRFEGDLDVFGADALKQRIDERLAIGRHSVEVDLGSCSFIDSAGLSLLLTTRERCRAAGGVFRVVGASPDIVRLFETVGVDELLLRP